METHRRGADGRRLFTTAFKQEQLARIAKGEVTLAELARDFALRGAPLASLEHAWQHGGGRRE
jgi:transposase-like protein